MENKLPENLDVWKELEEKVDSLLKLLDSSEKNAKNLVGERQDTLEKIGGINEKKLYKKEQEEYPLSPKEELSETQKIIIESSDNLKGIKEKYSPQEKPAPDNSLEKLLQKTKEDIAERKYHIEFQVGEIERKVGEKIDRTFSYNQKIKDWNKTYDDFANMLTSKPKSYSEVIKKRNRVAVGFASENKKDKIRRFLENYGGGIKPRYLEEDISLRKEMDVSTKAPAYSLTNPQLEKKLFDESKFSLPIQDYTEKALENERKKKYASSNSIMNYELQKALKPTKLEKISKCFRRFVKGVKKSPRNTIEYLIAGKEKAKTIYQGLKELKKLYPEKEGIRNPDCISNLDILKFIGDPNREPIYKLTEGADNHNKEKSSEKLKLLGHALISYHNPEEKYLRKTPKSVGERIISEKYLLEETILETEMEVFTRLRDKGYSLEKITKIFQDAGFDEKFI